MGTEAKTVTGGKEPVTVVLVMFNTRAIDNNVVVLAESKTPSDHRTSQKQIGHMCTDRHT